MRYDNGPLSHRSDMSSLLEFLLLAVFFASYLWKGIFFATGVLMAGSVLVLALSYWRTRRLEPLPLAVTILSLVLGSATLLLHDPAFIKWKFSIVEWLFGCVFLATNFTRQTLTERMLATQVKLPSTVWRRLNLMWAVFFLLLGSVNVYVLYQFDTADWVKFKVWWSTGAMLIFVVLQALYMGRHLKVEEAS
jgi:intracellular septation protein